jgi:hypothetical protein
MENDIRLMTGLTHALMFANIAAAGIEVELLSREKLFESAPYAALQTRQRRFRKRTRPAR